MPLAETPVKTESKRRRPRWIEHILVFLVALVVTVVRLLPLGLARALARLAGRLIYLFCGPNFLGVSRHLRIAFGRDLDDRRIRALARAFWIHICQGVVEAMQLSKWTAETCERRLDLTELEQVDRLRAASRGLILVSGHLGSWEVGPYLLALRGYPLHLLHNPGTIAPLFEYLKRQRERSGMRVLSKLEHPWALKKLLDKGACLCIAADLNAGRRGAFVPFFGVAASSYLSAAALQQATGCPIVVLSTARQPDGRHKVHVWETLERPRRGGSREELIETTRAIHGALERAIRAYPEQWLWNYRRWRSRPPGEVAEPDGLPPQTENP